MAFSKSKKFYYYGDMMLYLTSLSPFAYFFTTRLKGVIHKISWICIYFISISILYIYFNPQDSILHSLFVLLIVFCIIDMIYSNGYIQNDVITTKKEINPTLRLDTLLLTKMRQNFISIMFGRTLIILILFWILYTIDYAHMLSFAFLMLTLQFLYIIYNSQRNIINLLLIPFLSFLRFFAMLLPIIYNDFYTLTALFTLYPLPKFLEFSTQKRYKTAAFTSKVISNFDIFRVIYYVCYTIFCAILYTYGVLDCIFLMLSIYFLLFRLVCLVALQKSSLTSVIQHKRYENNPHKK